MGASKIDIDNVYEKIYNSFSNFDFIKKLQLAQPNPAYLGPTLQISNTI